MATRYFNPYTDFGFKKLFGEEGSKELLIDFLNQLLPPHHQIAQLSFKNSESLPDTYGERKAIFDLYCESSSGQQFIVEMQKAKLKQFVDHSQSKEADWNFNLLPIYVIEISDFLYGEQHNVKKFKRDVCLKDQDGNVFYDKLRFTFLQTSLFDKKEEELETHFDKWIYFLKNLESFDEIPNILNEPIFKRGFEIAELSHLSSEQHEQYQNSLLQYIEIRSALDTAREKG